MSFKEQKKRRPWQEREVNSLLTGVQRYEPGQWSEILNDRTLYFDERTPVDLKDKYRNLMKKCSKPELSFQVTPVPRHATTNTTTTTTTTNNAETVSVSKESPVKKVLPIITDVSEDGKCSVQVAGVGKDFKIEEIPVDFVTSFEQYKRVLLGKVAAVEKAIKIITNNPNSKADVNPNNKADVRKVSNQSSPLPPPDHNSKMHKDPSASPKKVPLQIIDDLKFSTQFHDNINNLPLVVGTSSPDYKGELESKRRRIVSSMERVRKQDAKDQNCIIS